MHINRIVPLAAGVLVALSGAAQAASPASTTFGVSATVAANCIVSALPIAFGNYDGTAEVNVSQDLSVRCTKNLPYTIRLNGGLQSSFPRKLVNGSDTLEYNLFRESGRTSVWGDGTSGLVVAGTGNGMGIPNANPHTIYARLLNSAANQAAPAGNYADTITVEVHY